MDCHPDVSVLKSSSSSTVESHLSPSVVKNAPNLNIFPEDNATGFSRCSAEAVGRYQPPTEP
ncbi:hypothetical protein FRX31_029389 [Thalictrum thalictroides]|uniref:Uncharacterized protein n=1 Tax=Thalictrum thalictroides TaxID=46969 RepID=A0A7J6V7C7_THATH|nr:hypothetical protein FRX31_029389 [Thalictrum thalictroides]